MIDEISSFMKVKHFSHVLDVLTSLVFTHAMYLNKLILLEIKHVSTGTEDNVISCPISLIQVK